MGKAKFEVRRSKFRRNRWHVVLIASNGEVLSTSESLNSVQAVSTNIDAQREAAVEADLVQWPTR